MKKELDFISIDGYYGADQHWFENKFMRLAGCSAVAASELCAYLALHFDHLKKLYPFDAVHITKQDFIHFMNSMFNFVTPGIFGMRSIRRFAKCFMRYTSFVGVDVQISLLSGQNSVERAKKFIVQGIGEGYCILYLLLTHKNIEVDEYTWHWFTLTGYEQKEGSMTVDFASWGKKHTLDFDKLWKTDKIIRGGMVIVK